MKPGTEATRPHLQWRLGSPLPHLPRESGSPLPTSAPRLTGLTPAVVASTAGADVQAVCEERASDASVARLATHQLGIARLPSPAGPTHTNALRPLSAPSAQSGFGVWGLGLMRRLRCCFASLSEPVGASPNGFSAGHFGVGRMGRRCVVGVGTGRTMQVGILSQGLRIAPPEAPVTG